MRPVLPALARVLLVGFTLALAGCVSSGSSKTSDRDAAVANVKLGVAYMQQGQLALAKEKLERAEKQDPRNVDVHTSLAFLYERLNDSKLAESQYRAAMRLSPGNAEVSNNYAVFLCRGGRVDEALEQFDKAAKDPLYRTPWAALTNSAVCLRSAKRSAEAVPYLESALRLRPNYAEAVLELGDAQIDLGKPEAAKLVVDRYLSMGQATPEVLLIGVRSALASGDRNAADVYARRLRRDFPNSPQARSLTQLMQGKG
jgi:type IV pilus assembly protein PilF